MRKYIKDRVRRLKSRKETRMASPISKDIQAMKKTIPVMGANMRKERSHDLPNLRINRPMRMRIASAKMVTIFLAKRTAIMAIIPRTSLVLGSILIMPFFL